MEKMSILKKTKKAYEEILILLNKYSDIVCVDIDGIKNLYEARLFELELKEKFGFGIKDNTIKCIYKDLYFKFNDYLWVGIIGDKYRRTISWEDDYKKPKNELMLVINFSTGAYIFGADYPTDIYKAFWKELKSYNPKYVDSQNSNLYFSMENAGNIFNEFYNIFNKHKEKNAKDFNARKIKKLKEEILRLK